MNFMKYHVSKNWFDAATAYGSMYDSATGVLVGAASTLTAMRNKFASSMVGVPITISIRADNVTVTRAYIRCSIGGSNIDSNNIAFGKTGTMTVTVTPTSVNDDWRITFGTGSGNLTLSNIMLNEGSTALPYEPYSSEVWHDTPHYIHNTSTDTTTTPADIYANATTATVGLKGNMYQASGVSPTNPIQPQECGDLETTGTHAGQYKIPISSASTTTPVYLGEVESTRRIKKLVLTGKESWSLWSSDRPDVERYYYKWGKTTPSDYGLICTHFPSIKGDGNFEHIRLGGSNRDDLVIFISKTIVSTLADFKSFLAAQYAAGTPVTVWYVLATPETGIVNEPLRKIGNYADSLSGITIPTTAGANTISVDTTLQPSEVTVNYKGWHPVADVHEKSKNLWDSGDVTVALHERYKSIPVSLKQGAYTLSFEYKSENTGTVAVIFYNGSTIIQTFNITITNDKGSASIVSGQPITAIRLYSADSYNSSYNYTAEFTNIMLNTGSTALPYEPYWT